MATGLGFMFLSQVNSLWQFYAAFTLITIGMCFGAFLVLTTTVANWFVEQRGRALASMSAGSGLGGLLVPLIVLLIASTDWRIGLLVIGIGFWVVGVPVALVLRSRPEDYGCLPDGRPSAESLRTTSQRPQGSDSAQLTTGAGTATLRRRVEADFTATEALKTRSFWQLALAMGAGQLIMSASVLQIPAMTSFGVSRGTAGLVILGVSLLSLVGRLGGGFLGDMMDKRRVIALAFACQFIGTMMFVNIGTAWHMMGFVLFWGVGFGGSIPVRFALLADYFGRRHFGTIMGIMMTVSTVFGVVGPVFVGWMADVRGNYRDPFLILAFTMLVSIPAILTLAQPIQRRRRTR